MGADGRSYAISGQWDPCDPSFQILNTETPKGRDQSEAFCLETGVNINQEAGVEFFFLGGGEGGDGANFHAQMLRQR